MGTDDTLTRETRPSVLLLDSRGRCRETASVADPYFLEQAVLRLRRPETMRAKLYRIVLFVSIAVGALTLAGCGGKY
jgi:hypothetical protein